MSRWLLGCWALLSLVACGGESWRGEGVILERFPEDHQVRVSHSAIEGLMPAMTMNFHAERPVLEALPLNERVSFRLQRRGNVYEIVSFEALGGVAGRSGGGAALANALDPASDFTLQDQEGQAVSLAALRGKLVVLDFVFTHCPGPCPILTATKQRVQERLGPELHERTLTMNGVSKSYAMTGWRIGYGAGPKPLMAAMKKIQGQSTYHPCTIAQWAAVEALNGPQEVLGEMLTTFTRRRNQTLAELDAVDGIACVPPDGAFYIFASIQAHLGHRAPDGRELKEDSDWVLALMEDQGVAVVPGSAFGTPGHFRLSFAAADDLLAEATRRIRNFVERLERA